MRERHILTEEQKSYILNYFKIKKYAEIAEHLNIPRYTVVYFLKKEGLEGTKKTMRLTKEQQEELAEHYNANRQYWADKFDVTIKDIAYAVEALNLGKREKSQKFSFTKEQDKFLLDNYLTSTQKELANAIGCNYQRVGRRLRELGINCYRRWTKENVQSLKETWLEKTDKELAKVTGRTEHAILSKRMELGLFRDSDNLLDKSKEFTGTNNHRKKTDSAKYKQTWTEEELLFLKENAFELSDDEIANILDRSFRAVKHKRLGLGLHRQPSRSSFEIEIENFMRDKQISHETQFKLGRYRYDFRIGNTLIEFNGDYFHCNPKLYKNGATTVSQAVTVEKDKAKLKKAKDFGYEVLVIWEHDFIFEKEKTLQEIMAVSIREGSHNEGAISEDAEMPIPR